MADFQTITHLIPTFGDRIDDPPVSTADQAVLRGVFEDVLGQSAGFIQPVLFRSGRLNVYAQAAVWGQHIQHRHDKLLTLCQAADLYVTEIKVKVRPDMGATRQTKTREAPPYNSDSASRHLEQFSEQLGKSALGLSVSRLAERIRKNKLERD